MNRKLKIGIGVAVVVLGGIAYYFSTQTNPTIQWAKKVTPEDITDIQVMQPQVESSQQYCQLEQAQYADITDWLNGAQLKKAEGEVEPIETRTVKVTGKDGLSYEIAGIGQQLTINQLPFTVREGAEAELNAILDGYSYTYTPEIEKQFQDFAKTYALTDAEVAYLEQQGYRKDEVVEMDRAKLLDIFLPGNMVNGDPCDLTLEQTEALQEKGINEANQRTLWRMGYTYDQMKAMSTWEYDFIFPVENLMDALEQRGFTADQIKVFGNETGYTYPEIIAMAMDTERYSDDLVQRAKAAGVTDGELEILFRRGYTQNEVEILLARGANYVKDAAVPGAAKEGEEIALPQREDAAQALANAGLDEEAYRILMRMGYTEEQALSISGAELELIFPNTQLMAKLAQRGVSDAQVAQLLQRGMTMRGVVQYALGH